MSLRVFAIQVVLSTVLVFTLYYDINFAVFPGEGLWNYKGFGGKFKFLTFINMWLQAIYWCITVLAGLSTFSYEHRKGKLHRVVDVLHSSLAFPVGIFVCIMFWMIYAVDRELVYPKILDKIIPSWLNHVMHTVHIPFLIADKFLVHHQYPKPFTGMITLLAFAMLYQCWVLYLGLVKAIWVYPILEVMNWPFRVAFFALSWMFFLLLYKVGSVMTAKIWGGNSKEKTKAK